MNELNAMINRFPKRVPAPHLSGGPEAVATGEAVNAGLIAEVTNASAIRSTGVTGIGMASPPIILDTKSAVSPPIWADSAPGREDGSAMAAAEAAVNAAKEKKSKIGSAKGKKN